MPLTQDIKSALNAFGSAPIYACRAWVNFNGAGTVAIRASGNVSSVTDNGTGDYTVNFISDMQDANYSISGCGRFADDTPSVSFHSSVLPEVSSCRILTSRDNGDAAGGVLVDMDIVTVNFYR